jgi:hypothetical protein
MTFRFPVLFSRFLARTLVMGLLAPFFWVMPAQAQTPDPELSALAHSRLPVQLLLNQGMTLLYGPAREALENAETDDLTAFGGAMGGRQEVSRTGYTSIDGFSFLAGLGRRNIIGDSPLAAFTYGFFAEGGTGSFETRGTLDAKTASSEGRGHYVGGGLILKTEFHNGAYMDGAFRVGQAGANLKTLKLENQTIDWDPSNIYFSAGGTLGWQADLTDQLELDVYGRLLWSHQGAGKKQGELQVASINSTRTVFGARADFQAGEGRVIYLGAGWEHEFNGRAGLAADSHEIPGSSLAELEGNSLVGEMGLRLAGADGFTASFGLDGALGRREALAGVLRLGYDF